MRSTSAAGCAQRKRPTHGWRGERLGGRGCCCWHGAALQVFLGHAGEVAVEQGLGRPAHEVVPPVRVRQQETEPAVAVERVVGEIDEDSLVLEGSHSLLVDGGQLVSLDVDDAQLGKLVVQALWERLELVVSATRDSDGRCASDFLTQAPKVRGHMSHFERELRKCSMRNVQRGPLNFTDAQPFRVKICLSHANMASN